DLGGFQWLGIGYVADAVGNIDTFQPDERDDIARRSALGVVAAQAVEDLKLLHLGLGGGAVALDDGHLLAGLDRPVVDSSDADPADVVVVEDGADLDLQALIRIAMRG